MRKLGLLLAVITVGGGVAHAEGKWGVGLRTTAQNIAPESNVDNKLNMQGGGIHVRYRMNHRWGFELASEHVTAELGGGAYTRESNPVTLTASFHFGRSIKWDWYVLAGLGATESQVSHTRMDGQQVDEVFKETHVHIGFGLERHWQHIAIGAELRAIGLDRDPEAGDAPAYGDADGPIPASESGSQLNITATYYF